MADGTEALANFLGSKVGVLTKGTNLFGGSLREESTIPANAVFINPVGGPEPQRRMGQTLEFRERLYNVIVRNSNWLTGLTIAQGVVDAFNGNDAVPTGELDARPLMSAPQGKGLDEKGRHLFYVPIGTINETST